MGKSKALYFLRKDLRIQDNKIISEMADAGYDPVLIYLWNQEHLKKEGRGSCYIRFLKDRLHLFQQEAAEHSVDFRMSEGSLGKEGREIILQENPTIIFLQRQYLPWEVLEETKLKKEFGAKVNIISGNYLLSEPGEVVTAGGGIYKVFTPFYRKWSEWQNQINHYQAKHLPIRYHSELQQQLEYFFRNSVAKYSSNRDFPAGKGTSGLSKYINLGVISARFVYSKAIEAAVKHHADTEPFIRQLAWRDFYYHLYYNKPEILYRAFKEAYDQVPWQNNPEWLKAWKSGQTGYPFVDAGMRQLLAEGFMHNRLRMVVASFLTKDLLIDWKKGERHFMQHLTDGDLILNNGGWQWAASTGADAQPYFRIFNPVEQSKKFDREGHFIRKYVPELRNVPQKYIHEPWKMPDAEQKNYNVHIGSQYPSPIVDHKEQRLKALDMYRI